MPSLSSSCTGQQQTDRRVRRLCFVSSVSASSLTTLTQGGQGSRSIVCNPQPPPKREAGSSCLRASLVAFWFGSVRSRSALRSCASPSFVGEPSGAYQGREGRALSGGGVAWTGWTQETDTHPRDRSTHALSYIKSNAKVKRQAGRRDRAQAGKLQQPLAIAVARHGGRQAGAREAGPGKYGCVCIHGREKGRPSGVSIGAPAPTPPPPAPRAGRAVPNPLDPPPPQSPTPTCIPPPPQKKYRRRSTRGTTGECCPSSPTLHPPQLLTPSWSATASRRRTRGRRRCVFVLFCVICGGEGAVRC